MNNQEPLNLSNTGAAAALIGDPAKFGRVAEDGTVVPMVVKAGDRVLFSQHAGQTVKLDNEEFRILREEDVMAIVNQGE